MTLDRLTELPALLPSDYMKWTTRLSNEEIWLDKNNKVHLISEMETSHIIHTLNMLYRHETLMAVCWVYESSDPLLAYSYLGPDWLAETPVVRAFSRELKSRGIVHDR